MSVVTAWSREAISVLPVVAGKSIVMLRAWLAPVHVPITLILNVTVELLL
nr:hypothetical protein [Serratia fonticola]